MQTSNESSKSWEASVGRMPHSSLRQQIKSLWTEAVNPNEKQIKNETKAALLAGALRSSGPAEQTVPSWKGEAKQRPPVRYDQCAHCKETGHWRDKHPHCRGSEKFSPSNNERYQPEPAVQNLIGQSRISLGETRLPDPGTPGAHGHDESRGPIDGFYGGHRS